MQFTEISETYGTDGPSEYWWQVVLDPEREDAASLVIRGERPPYTEPLFLMHFATDVALDMARLIWGERLRAERGTEPTIELEVELLDMDDDVGPVVEVGIGLVRDAA